MFGVDIYGHADGHLDELLKACLHAPSPAPSPSLCLSNLHCVNGDGLFDGQIGF